MAAESVVEQKLVASVELAHDLLSNGSPLLATFWDFDSDVGRWTLMLVPMLPGDERRLRGEAINLLGKEPYRSVLSVSDPAIDSTQIDRARALGAYIRVQPFVGRRFDTTFTGDQYFESVIPVYLAPELMTHLSPA